MCHSPVKTFEEVVVNIAYHGASQGEQAWANRRRNRCFPERLHRSRNVRSIAVSATLMNQHIFFCEMLFGAYTEFALRIEAQTLPKQI